MMMRCLGGPNDGEWYNVDLKLHRFGDHYKVPAKPKLFTIDFDPDKIPELITVSYNLYRISYFSFSKDDRYWFLVPEKWTDRRAIVHQLEKNYSDGA